MYSCSSWQQQFVHRAVRKFRKQNLTFLIEIVQDLQLRALSNMPMLPQQNRNTLLFFFLFFFFFFLSLAYPLNLVRTTCWLVTRNRLPLIEPNYRGCKKSCLMWKVALKLQSCIIVDPKYWHLIISSQINWKLLCLKTSPTQKVNW